MVHLLLKIRDKAELELVTLLKNRPIQRPIDHRYAILYLLTLCLANGFVIALPVESTKQSTQIMPQNAYPTDAINELIRNRRSVFPNQFSGEIIPDELIRQILENANWAPNHGKTEPWRFFVFKGEGLKSLAKFQSELYREVTPEAEFQQAKFDKLARNPMLASHVIAIAMKRQESGKIPEIEEVEAVACAVQNIYLTATAYGLGGYWGSGGVTYLEEAKEFFGLSADDKLLGFFYLGIPKQAPAEGHREPWENKVTWIDEAVA